MKLALHEFSRASEHVQFPMQEKFGSEIYGRESDAG